MLMRNKRVKLIFPKKGEKTTKGLVSVFLPTKSQESCQIFSEITISKVATDFLALLQNLCLIRAVLSPPSIIKYILNIIKKHTQTFMVNGVLRQYVHMKYVIQCQNE